MEEKNKANHYYISLPSQKPEADIIDFEMKMLEQNQIRGLLPAAREYQDTEVRIYFDISGRQNLEQRYAWQKLTGREVKQILRTIADVAAELEEYMLDYNHLNLMPEYMYGMLEPGDLCFCYEPWDSETFGERLRPLALWFLDHMDYREREEVIFSYEFQRFCEENDVSLALLGQFMAGKTDGGSRQSGREFHGHRESGRAAAKAGAESGRTAAGAERESGGTTAGAGRESGRTAAKAGRESGRTAAGAGRESGRTAAGAARKAQAQAGTFFEEEAGTDGTFIWEETFSDMDGKKNGGMKDLLRRIFPAGGKRYTDFSDMDSLRVAEDETEYGRKTTRGRRNARFRNPESDNIEKKSDETKTAERDASFSESGEEVKEEKPILGELTSGKMPTLSIRAFPCFLGSDGELTDCEIADESVSRIHARLFCSDGRIWVEDLRSENGTFLNGDRMLPNEPWVLNHGDELKVGNCQYRFRLET